MTIATLVLALMVFTTPVYEEGATFDGGICWEADGTEGISTAWGDCMTAADYDELYSYENLAVTPNAYDPSISIADTYELVPDEVPASTRELGAGLVAETFTFVGHIQAAHLPRPV